MQLHDIYIHSYKHIRNCYKLAEGDTSFFAVKPIKIIWFRFFYSILTLIAWIANKTLPLYLHYTKSKNLAIQENIVVSLTSFPARINYVWLTIETIKRQTIRPFKIILYLSKEQFPNQDNDLPQNLLNECDELFEIKFVDDDLRSHKKYYYAFQEYANKNVVTFDDDVFYESHILEYLYHSHKKNVGCIISSRACVINPKAKYHTWVRPKEKNIQMANLLPIGIGGVLYPPLSYSQKIFDKKAIKEKCYKADDLWLNYMCRLQGSKIVMIDWCYGNITIDIKNNVTLYDSNIDENDQQIKNISEWGKLLGLPDFFHNNILSNKG